MDVPSGNLQGPSSLQGNRDDIDVPTRGVNPGNLQGPSSLQGNRDDIDVPTRGVNPGVNSDVPTRGVNPGVNSDGGKADDIDAQIHQLEQEAYSSVLRAFKAQADTISLEKESLMTELRKELRLSNEEQRELLGGVNSDNVIRRIREWRQSGGHQPGMLGAGQSDHDPMHIPSVSVALPSQSFAGLSPTFHPPSVTAANQPSSSVVKRGPMVEPKCEKHKSGQMDEPTLMGVNPNGGDDSVLLNVASHLCTYRMEGQLIHSPEALPVHTPQAPPLNAPQSVPPPQSGPQPQSVPLLPQPAIQVPLEIASIFYGAQFLRIISKRLLDSDVMAGKARFTMPKNQILQQDFLSGSEVEQLGMDRLRVDVRSVSGRSYMVDLKIYSSGKSEYPTKVLTGLGWRTLVDENSLKVGDTIELWKAWNVDTILYIFKIC
ncbi:hypothetical protein KY285_037236 [Solanum tuberosum]|nr:hypothetical protein KY285_037236 [Solanum tuberosum]